MKMFKIMEKFKEWYNIYLYNISPKYYSYYFAIFAFYVCVHFAYIITPRKF